MEGADDVPVGLYDTVVNQALSDRISQLDARRLRAQLAEVDPAELPERIAEIGRGVDGRARRTADPSTSAREVR